MKKVERVQIAASRSASSSSLTPSTSSVQSCGTDEHQLSLFSTALLELTRLTCPIGWNSGSALGGPSSPLKLQTSVVGKGSVNRSKASGVAALKIQRRP